MSRLVDYLGPPAHPTQGPGAMSPNNPDAPTATFAEAMHNADNDRTNLLQRTIGTAALGAHLEQISGEAAGTPLEQYLSPEQVTVCTDFLNEAEARGWRGSEELEFISRANGRKHIWTKPTQYPSRTHKGDSYESLKIKGRRTHPITSDVVARGYEIGYIGLSDTDKARVMLCDDHTLRVRRSPYTFRRSHGMGYGRLPDPEAVSFSLAERVSGSPLMFRLVPAAENNLQRFLAEYLIEPSPKPRQRIWESDRKTFLR